MRSISEKVESYLRAKNWQFNVDSGRITFPAIGSSGSWLGIAEINEEKQTLAVFSVLPEPVPQNQREAVALYLTRANFGLLLGNFELDLTDGELRYKTSVDVEGCELEPAMIDHLFAANLIAMDHYLPGIEAVIEGEDPEVAVAAIEGAKGTGRGPG